MKSNVQKEIAANPMQKSELKAKFEAEMKQIENKAIICKNIIHNF